MAGNITGCRREGHKQCSGCQQNECAPYLYCYDEGPWVWGCENHVWKVQVILKITSAFVLKWFLFFSLSVCRPSVVTVVKGLKQLEVGLYMNLWNYMRTLKVSRKMHVVWRVYKTNHHIPALRLNNWQNLRASIRPSSDLAIFTSEQLLLCTNSLY